MCKKDGAASECGRGKIKKGTQLMYKNMTGSERVWMNNIQWCNFLITNYFDDVKKNGCCSLQQHHNMSHFLIAITWKLSEGMLLIVFI